MTVSAARKSHLSQTKPQDWHEMYRSKVGCRHARYSLWVCGVTALTVSGSAGTLPVALQEVLPSCWPARTESWLLGVRRSRCRRAGAWPRARRGGGQELTSPFTQKAWSPLQSDRRGALGAEFQRSWWKCTCAQSDHDG